MKAKDLKKILDTIPGEMEIKMLLPEVEDWADIKTEKIRLKRMKKEERVGLINWQNKEYNLGRPEVTLDEIEDSEWEIHNYYLEDEVKEMYELKEALLLRPRFKGKTTFDRTGNITY